MSSRAALSSSSRLRSTASAASLRFDRPRVGGIDEGQPSGRVARPHRRRQLFDQRAQRRDLGQQRLVPPGELEQLALDAARVLEPEHGAAGDGAALRLDRTAGERRQRHRESFAARAQRLDRSLHAARLAGIEPAAEGEHAMRRGDADDGGIAFDGRLIGRRRPVHHHLRLGQQQRVGAVEFGAQRGDLVVRRSFQARRAGARAQQHDRGDHGKQQQARAAARGPRSRAGRCCGRRRATSSCRASWRGSWRREPAAAQDSANGCRESALPRTSIAPAPPDRVRHAPLPLLAATAIASGSIAGKSANRRLYSQAESRRKSPDRERATERYFALSDHCRRPSQAFGMARHVVQIDAAERLSEFLLGSGQSRKHDFDDTTPSSAPRRLAVDRSGGAQNVVGRYAARARAPAHNRRAGRGCL